MTAVPKLPPNALTPSERDALAAIAAAYRLELTPPLAVHFELRRRGLIELDPIGGLGSRPVWRRNPSPKPEKWRATISARGRAALAGYSA